MPEREFPKNILTIPKKFLMGLTLQRCVGLVVGITLGLVVYLMMPAGLSATTKIIVVAIVAIIPILLCFLELYNMPLYKALKVLIPDNLMSPRVRYPESGCPKLPTHDAKKIRPSRTVREVK